MTPWEQLAASQQALDDCKAFERKLARLPQWRWLARRRLTAEREAHLSRAEQHLLAYERS